jgi:microtubule-associated protein-like 1/2
MLSEGTLLSGGERDRKIIAWDTLQNYKKITETKVGGFQTKPFVYYLRQ